MKKGVLGLLAILMVCSCGEKKENRVKAPTRVKTEVLNGQSSMSNGQSYVGIVEEHEATAVSFTGMGVVKRVLVSDGQTVGRGQLIAEMDDTQARNLLAGAEAQMTQANDALERFKMLHDNGSLPEVQWVEIQSKVAQAKSQLEVAKKNLADCRLVAPVGGIIGKKLVGAGETALPSQAVVTILDISSVKVKVSIPEAEISGITASTPTTINVEAAQKQMNGGRIEKGVQADALTHTYEVRINVQNADRKLLPGMVASVSLTPSPSLSGEGDYSLPITCIQKAVDGSLFVWTVAADSTAHRSKVSTGETMGNRVAITEGLDLGQRVVTDGYQKLSEGTKVVY
jgi:RND family efflux transporter MFP subunit